MRLRGRYLPLVALLGAFVAMLPAVASSETSPTIDAVNASVYNHYWSPMQATVGAGGSVTFRNATAVPHGVEWRSPPATPGCTSGVPVGTTAAASGTQWSGTCSFAQPGAYTFYCTVHGAEMTGTITVNASGTTTTSTTTTGTSTTTTTPTTSVPGGSVPPPAPRVSVFSLASTQRGAVVRGTLGVSQAAAGGRLLVELFARGEALGKPRATRVRVGRLVRTALTSGYVSFHVRLDAAARRALKRRTRLKLVVRITLTPPHGAPSSITRTVLAHVSEKGREA